MQLRGLRIAAAMGFGLAAACTNTVGDPNPFETATATESTSSPASTGAGPTSSADDSTGAESSGGAVGSSSSSSSGGFGALCGDGNITGNEECDCGGAACTPSGLDNLTCVDVGMVPEIPGLLTGGSLACSDTSCKLDTTACTYCGDREINGIEGCEPEIPIAQNCVDIGMGSAGLLTCDDECQIDTSGCTDCGVMLDFETAGCPHGFITGRTAGGAAPESWECGNPTVGPTMLSGTWGTNLTGNYSDNESGFVASPAIDLSMCMNEDVSLTVSHWHDFETNVLSPDGGILQVSTDGVNWNTIAPTSGHPYGGTIGSAHPPTQGATGWTGAGGDKGVLIDSVFDVTAFAGSATFQFRFVFGSDSSNNREGWFIDAVEILGSGD